LPAVAMGYALVDYKQTLAEKIAFDDQAAAEFINEAAGLHVCAGGSVANTLVAYQRYSQSPARLYYCIGNDKRGDLFYRQTGVLLGRPQVTDQAETGCCLLNLDREGNIFDEITLDGAAASVSIPTGELNDQNNGLVISNVNTLRNPAVLKQTVALLQGLNRRQGVFAFRLSGAHNVLASQQEARSAVENLPAVPDVAFGNTAEIKNLLDTRDASRGLELLLPDTRVMFITDGGDEILVRYEGDVFSLQPAAADVVDVSGAGDHFMGVTLAEMMRRPPAEWSSGHILKAAAAGMRAAAMVLGSLDSRLPQETLRQIGGSDDDTRY